MNRLLAPSMRIGAECAPRSVGRPPLAVAATLRRHNAPCRGATTKELRVLHDLHRDVSLAQLRPLSVFWFWSWNCAALPH